MRFCFETKQFVETHVDADKLAIIGSNGEITWHEFKNRVEAFCDYFRQNNWQQVANPVLLYGHKEMEMVVAVYALMMMEIPYIPADVIYPMDRVKSIQQIAACNLVINCSNATLPIDNVTMLAFYENQLCVVQKGEVALADEKPMDPLVYLIFTSGSTGEPKGVQISTEAVKDFIEWMTADFGFTAKDVFVNIAVLSFDLSVFELMTFGALGATILLNAKEVTENPDLLLPRIKNYRGTIWVSTPSFCFIYSRIEEVEYLQSIKHFLFCGELLPHSLAQQLVKKFPNATVWNTYGPTEATVATTQIAITQEILDQYPILPVGKSKPRSKLLIQEEEIIIVGKNVSKGYLNRADLNAEKFIEVEGMRAFKTGDQGYLENNVLFFKGRSDDQVKLHGFRIELNEITSQINHLEGVLQSETIALKRNGEVKKIVSLVQLKSDAKISQKEEILEKLKRKLPYYMLPSDIKFIEKIPLNNNGKADKKMLELVYLGRN